MQFVRIVLRGTQSQRLARLARKTRDAGMRTRLLIIIHASWAWTKHKIAQAVGCCERTVMRVCARWVEEGEAGLVDRREDNGLCLADEAYERTVARIIAERPDAFGHSRPTWTLKLIIETARRQTGKTVSTSTMSRLLKRIGARWGRPKPLAPCPWSKRAIRKHMNEIHWLIARLTPKQVVVWEDEADIDLNPRIGPDWMHRGTQRTVMTPGKNKKMYIAGAMEEVTGKLVWTWAKKKCTGLFISLLKQLLKSYADKERIHVILDNYSIHSSKRLKAWLAEHGSKLRLHFLPPYCPDENRIERSVWRDVHANVTYNHQCLDLDELCGNVTQYLKSKNRVAQRRVA